MSDEAPDPGDSPDPLGFDDIRDNEVAYAIRLAKGDHDISARDRAFIATGSLDARFPVQLTTFAQETIVEALRKGRHPRSACARASITVGILQRWLRCGWHFPDGHKLKAFFHACEIASADARDDDDERLLACANASGDWRAIAHRQRMREPKLYREKQGELSAQAQAVLVQQAVDAQRPPDESAIKLDLILGILMRALAPYPEARQAAAAALEAASPRVAAAPTVPAPSDDE